MKVEPGVAVPLTAPQSSRFTPGGEVSLEAYLGLGRYFDLQAGVSFLSLPAAAGTMPEASGTAWSDSLGLRFQRPHDAALERGAFYAGSPWIDADGLFVRTGGLDRFGLTVGAGVSWPLAPKRNIWLGPFVRYMQIVQPDRMGFDDTDARVLFVGLNFELGTSPLAPLVVERAVECPVLRPRRHGRTGRTRSRSRRRGRCDRQLPRRPRAGRERRVARSTRGSSSRRTGSS